MIAITPQLQWDGLEQNRWGTLQEIFSKPYMYFYILLYAFLDVCTEGLSIALLITYCICRMYYVVELMIKLTLIFNSRFKPF